MSSGFLLFYAQLITPNPRRTIFHTTYCMLHFNPDSENPLVLLFFNSSKFFSFMGMHISTPSGLCPMKPVSCQSLIPLRSRRGFRLEFDCKNCQMKVYAEK